ncbi:MAG: 3-deoxy-D-manno-octulosonic acid transferase [Tannerella sp.]|jgi:3-deoxy-D-manno-octulosonic-acid transferase|nr:3-deoxy-D-manno-octulosonic acid transferase [Tannerella sp.]
MRYLYTIVLHLYAFSIEVASFFNRKARMTRLGQWHTNGILRKKISRDAKYVWFHCASLGEFEQGRPLMEALRKRCPELKILLTFFSPSGYEVRKNYTGADVICYLPFDTPFKVRKFLHLAKPCAAVFIKYEFWLNYLTELKHRGIKTYIVSAIFRPDQLFFKWYGAWYRKILSYYERLFVQDEDSRRLLADYGVNNVEVCGDTRFDRVLEIQSNARLLPEIEEFASGNRLVLVAGSTWPEDEEILIPYFNAHPEIKLIIAPHEINREHLLYIQSLLNRPSIRLSESRVNNSEASSNVHAHDSLKSADCLIIDSFGLLSSIYRYGHIAYIGGGFGRGIHNTLEAAVYAIPVVFGPKYQKFKEAQGLIDCGGGFTIDGRQAFDTCLNNFIFNTIMRTESGDAAGAYVHNKVGATEKILEYLKNSLTE